MAPPRRSLLAILLSALVILGHVGGSLHQASHVHVYCARHGRMEHGSPADRADRSLLPSRLWWTALPATRHGHDACWFPPLLPSDDPAPGSALAAQPRFPPASALAPPERLFAEEIWLLAPKHSPPPAV